MKKSIVIISFLSSPCLSPALLFSQKALTTGDAVAVGSVGKILNHSAMSGSFKNLQGKITVLDFFGTWCVPCLKALPHLNTPV